MRSFVLPAESCLHRDTISNLPLCGIATLWHRHFVASPLCGIATLWYSSIASMRAGFKECRPASLFFRHRLLQMVYRAEYFVKFISIMQPYLSCFSFCFFIYI